MDKKIRLTIISLFLGIVGVLIAVNMIVPITNTLSSNTDGLYLTTTDYDQNTTENTGESFTQSTPNTITLNPTYTIYQLISVGNSSQNFTEEETLYYYQEQFNSASLSITTSPENFNDTLWEGGGSACEFSNGDFAYVNYTLPTGNNSAEYKLSVSSGVNLTYNLYETYCIKNPIEIRIDTYQTGSGPSTRNWINVTCNNGSEFLHLASLGNSIGGVQFFEEAMTFGERRYDDQNFLIDDTIIIADNTTLKGNVYITYSENGTLVTGEDYPLGDLFKTTGLVFLVIMGVMLIFTIKFIYFKRWG